MKLPRYSLLLLIAAMAALLVAPPVAADTIIDDQGTSWTVIRQFNKASNGWDLRLVVDGDEDHGIWVTHDATLDQDPVIAIDPNSGRPMIYWSRQVGTEFRIYRSAFLRGEFSEPTAVTTGGLGFADRQPFVQYDTFGQCHLVWFRQRSTGVGAALYSLGTGTSWSLAEKINLPLDHVIGTVTIDVPIFSDGFISATYQYFSSATGSMETREVYRGGDTSPWIARH